MTGRSHLDEWTVRSALQVACRAPSVHNTQPWQWRLGEQSLHLYADRERALGVADPDGRELVISCGAALHHARIAFTALGWHSRVTRLPNPRDEDHLAALEFTRVDHVVAEQSVALTEAAHRRHTDRRPYLAAPISARLLARFEDCAREEQVRFRRVDDPVLRRELQVALVHADRTQRDDPAYQGELRVWAGRHMGAVDGVPARTIPGTGPMVRSLPSRYFGRGELEMPPALDDGGELCLFSTASDELEEWLRTGEALSAVLLHATVAGLASCTLSQIAEVGTGRTAIRRALDDGYVPQLALRLGWPVTADFPAIRTPRRSTAEILQHLTRD